AAEHLGEGGAAQGGHVHHVGDEVAIGGRADDVHRGGQDGTVRGAGDVHGRRSGVAGVDDQQGGRGQAGGAGGGAGAGGDGVGGGRAGQQRHPPGGVQRHGVTVDGQLPRDHADVVGGGDHERHRRAERHRVAADQQVDARRLLVGQNGQVV